MIWLTFNVHCSSPQPLTIGMALLQYSLLVIFSSVVQIYHSERVCRNAYTLHLMALFTFPLV